MLERVYAVDFASVCLSICVQFGYIDLLGEIAAITIFKHNMDDNIRRIL